MSETPVKIIPVAPTEPSDASGMARRTMLQTLLGGVSGGLVLPSIVEAQHPVHQHLQSATAVEQAQKKAAAKAYKPEFLDAHQFKTLEVLSEAIVPGSTTAKVAPFLDILLAVELPQTQRTFLSALGAFDMAAIRAHGKAWSSITATERDAILQSASTGESGRAKGTTTMRDHFQTLKGWIAGAFYSSEQGMRELGWTGNMFHAELPGCTHPGGHSA